MYVTHNRQRTRHRECSRGKSFRQCPPRRLSNRRSEAQHELAAFQDIVSGGSRRSDTSKIQEDLSGGSFRALPWVICAWTGREKSCAVYRRSNGRPSRTWRGVRFFTEWAIAQPFSLRRALRWGQHSLADIFLMGLLTSQLRSHNHSVWGPMCIALVGYAWPWDSWSGFQRAVFLEVSCSFCVRYRAPQMRSLGKFRWYFHRRTRPERERVLWRLTQPPRSWARLNSRGSVVS